MHPTKRHLSASFLVVVAVSSLFTCLASAQQDYPSKPISIVDRLIGLMALTGYFGVPFSIGGTS